MDVPNDALNPNVTQSTTIRALKDITYGSVAGMVSKVFEHPFDLTKVRLQSQVLDSTARFSGPIDCLNKTWKYEGFRGLYRGLPAPVVGAMAENASLFMSYRFFQALIKKVTHKVEEDSLPLPQIALAAAGAGAVTSFVLTPIELVKCKMQVQMLVRPSVPNTPLPGPIAVLITTIKSTGLSGLWLGHTGTLIRETGGTAAWFGTKEFVAGKLLEMRTAETETPTQNKQLTPVESAISGACAGAMFNLALFPADSVKSAMQTEEELRGTRHAAGTTFKSPTFLGTLRSMYRAQGIRGLYAGCGITVARSIPSSAIIFVIYDELERRFG